MTEKLDSWAATRTLIKLRNQAPPLIPAEQSDSFALSLSQERLLALEQLNTQPLYNLPYAFHLQGRLNLSALNQSLVMMLHRQQVLRTTFETTNGQPKQVIQPSQPIELAPIDLSHLSPEQAKTEIITALRQPFNLPQEPPFRCRLYYLGSDEYVLGFTFHHIIYDYWSQSIFFRELNSCYTAYLNNIEPALKSLPIQYADFAIWQRQWLSQPGVLEFLLDYWQPQLQGLNQPDLPADNVSADRTERVMKQLKITFSAEQVTALKVLARQTKVQLFTILLTALKLVVANHLKTSDVAIFSPVTNRHRPEFQHLMGDFSNLLILRTDLAGEFTITELLQRVGQTVSGAIAYQDLPLQLIKASIPLKLPQISFSYLNTPQQTLVLPHLVIESWDLASGTDDFDLLLYMMESQDELSGYLKYNTCLLSQTMIQEMINQFQTSLMDMIRQPEQSISNQVFKPPQEQATNELLLSIPDLIDQIQYPLKKSRPASVLQQQLSLAPAEERYELLETHIKSEIKLIMGTVPSDERSFFDLGMDSLMSIQLSNRLSAALQMSLPTTTVLQHPTVEGLARFVLDTIGLVAPIETQPTEIILNQHQFPLSYGQQALWFIYQQDPHSWAYNIPLPLDIQGQLDLTILQQAISQLVARHPALRTIITLVEDEPRQEVQPTTDIPLQHHEATGWSEDKLGQELQTLAHQPVDLSQFPTARFDLFHCSADRHILMITQHHILTDALSIGVLVADLFELYHSLGQGTAPNLPPLSATIADYVAGERSLLDSPQGAELASYWQEQLAGEIPILNLPADYPRPKMQSYNGASLPFTLPEPLGQQLKRLAQQEQTTLFTLFLTIFQLLLHRYTGQPDIWVGTPTSAGRLEDRFANLIGYLVNPVVIRASFENEGKLPFKELLAANKQTILEALDHQRYPFPLLVQQLQPQREPAYPPLFQVMFSFENEHLISLSRQSGELSISGVEIAQQEGQFDLTLTIREDEGLSGQLSYNTDLFKPETIERMVGHLQTLLAGIVTNPNQSIAELPLLTEAERQQILVEWNDTTTDYPADKTIHQLFEEQVARTPDNIAVLFEDEQLTYRELNQRANQLAHHLRTLGVGPEVLVGICVERSLEMMVGLLGILKAGGAYVPLDPTYPAERLTFMLADADVPVLLTQSHLRDSLPAGALRQAQDTTKVVCLDSDWTEIETLPNDNLEVAVKPDNLVYVIYTSGSTGQPKGVMIEHRSLVSFCEGTKRYYNFTLDDRVLQFATLSFDAAGNEIYPCLISGSTLILRNEVNSAELFLQQCREWGITILTPPTAYWHYLTTELIEKNLLLPEVIRLVTIGGEEASVSHIRFWAEYVGNYPKLINEYGPTEATIVSIRYELTQQWYEESSRLIKVPIGKPTANVQLYVLDNQLKLVPIGVIGELHIGGKQLARGYLNRPELTVERFILNPFGEGRLYKTGDLVRWLPDGNIEFIGRVDHQVKIRGFRIELGEIESCLKQNRSINDVVVTLNNKNQSSLVAYLTLNNSLKIKGRKYYVYTCQHNSNLQFEMELIHLNVWPRFFNGDATLIKYWKQLYKIFPIYQVALTDQDKVVGVCNAIPFYWDGLKDTLPQGWDEAIARGFKHHQENIIPNTMCILAGAIHQNYQNRGLSYELLKIMKSFAFTSCNVEHLIVPVRPTHKTYCPDILFEQYCEQTQDDGLSIDPWLRVHQRLKGTILALCPQSQFIEGTIEQWKIWTGQSIEQSGDYLFEGCMQPVKINVEQDKGIYYDFAVWVAHTLEPYLAFNPADTVIESLRNRLMNVLPNYMIPNDFVILNQFPLTPNGKIDRNALPGLEMEDPATGRAYEAPQTPTEELLAAIWATVLGREQIGRHDDFFELGGHSLLAIQLMAKIEANIGQRLPLTRLFQAPTIAQFAKLLNQDVSAQPNLALIPLQPTGHQPPFFCFPGAGTTVLYLRELAQQLAANQPFYGLQPPGLEANTTVLSTMTELVTFFRSALTTKNMAEIQHLGGHSAGGMMAFSLALALQEDGYTVPQLTLFEALPPGTETVIADYPVTVPDKQHAFIELMQILQETWGDEFSVSLSELEPLSETDRWAYLSNDSGVEIDIEYLKRLVTSYQKTTEMMTTYRPQDQYQGQLILFIAEESPLANLDGVISGWQAVCEKPIIVHRVPGNHLSLLKSPHVERLAERLQDLLNNHA